MNEIQFHNLCVVRFSQFRTETGKIQFIFLIIQNQTVEAPCGPWNLHIKFAKFII